MKIVDLHIQGFRSLKDVSWKPGDLNLIIGPNGSGKSNLLKALEMLLISAQGGLSKFVSGEGGMNTITWDGTSQKISFHLNTHVDPFAEEASSLYLYDLELDQIGNSSAFRIEKEFLDVLNQNGDRLLTGHAQIDRKQSSALVYDDDPPESRDLDLENQETETVISMLSPIFSGKLISPDSRFKKYLTGWRIYQDFQTHRNAEVRKDAVSRKEMVVDPDGSNLIQALHTLYTSNREFKRDLNLAMKAAFSDDFEELVFPPSADQRIQLRLRWQSLQKEQSSADLSDGTLRFLYLISILANPSPPMLIAIDEPENGLHPSMLPIIAEYARDASKRTQVILTTHSAELLDAFSEYSPTVTVAKVENGQSTFNIVTKAQLDYWLQDYTLGKLFRSGSLEDMG